MHRLVCLRQDHALINIKHIHDYATEQGNLSKCIARKLKVDMAMVYETFQHEVHFHCDTFHVRGEWCNELNI